MANTICIICARGGSKGVPRKNIRFLAGKPLITHSISAAQAAGVFSDILVSTEDPEIAEIASDYGATVPFLRPRKLATDTAKKNDVLLFMVSELHRLGWDFDYVVDKDPSVPLLGASDLAKASEAIVAEDCDTVVGVTESHLNPYFNIVEFGPDGFLGLSKTDKSGMEPTYFSRQSCPAVFSLHGLTAFKREVFLSQGYLYGKRTLPLYCRPERSLMIDSEFDLTFAEYLLSSGVRM